MELNNITIGSYIAISYSFKAPVICKVSSITDYIHGLVQGVHGKENVTFYKRDGFKIKAIPFVIDILEIEGWEYNRELNCWRDSTKQITIQKNEELCTYPFSVHIDNSDMDTIGRLNFTYFHELQSFCNICNVPISFKMGSVIYCCKNLI